MIAKQKLEKKLYKKVLKLGTTSLLSIISTTIPLDSKLKAEGLSIIKQSKTKTIHVGTDNWYPYEFGPKPEGLMVDIFEEVMKRMEFDIEYDTQLPWSRTLHYISGKNPKITIALSGVKNKQREQSFYFTDIAPSYISWQGYSSPNPNPNFKEAQLIVVNGYHYPQELLSQFKPENIYQTHNSRSVLKMLEIGRGDYGLMEEKNAQKIKEKENVTLLPIPTLQFTQGIYPLIKKNWKHTEELNNIITQMYNDNTLTKIHKKWGMEYPLK